MIREAFFNFPGRGVGEGGRVPQDQKDLKKCLKLNWNFQRRWGGGQ